MSTEVNTKVKTEVKTVDMQDARIALHEAKFDLISLQPFYAILLQKHSFRWDEAVGTAGVGVTSKGIPILIVSPSFFLSLSKFERVGLLMHEMLHVVMRHNARGKDLDKRLANIAMDIAINQHIPKEILPQGALLPEPFKLRPLEAFEFYYVSLLNNPQNRPQSGQGTMDNHDIGDESLSPSGGEEGEGIGEGFADDAIAQAAVDQALAEAIKTTEENYAGKMPQAIKRIITDRFANKTKTNWRSILKSYIGRNTSSERTTTRNKPNRRMGFMAPGMKRLESPKVLVGIDHSGSVSDSMVSSFEDELRGILSALAERTEVAYFDTQIHSVEKLRDTRGRDTTRRASGGTDFSCLMKYAEEAKPDVVVVLTDGEASMPKPPRCPIIWVVIGNSSDAHLKGRKIRLKWDDGGFKA
jgi:predicted metal-dependent peptidase